MFGIGLLMVVLGNIAEIPLASIVAHGGQYDVTSSCMYLMGATMIFWGLAQMAIAKRQTWAVAILTFAGLVGTTIGLIIVLAKGEEDPIVEAKPKQVEWCSRCGRELRTGRCMTCDKAG